MIFSRINFPPNVFPGFSRALGIFTVLLLLSPSSSQLVFLTRQKNMMMVVFYKYVIQSFTLLAFPPPPPLPPSITKTSSKMATLNFPNKTLAPIVSNICMKNGENKTGPFRTAAAAHSKENGKLFVCA